MVSYQCLGSYSVACLGLGSKVLPCGRLSSKFDSDLLEGKGASSVRDCRDLEASVSDEMASPPFISSGLDTA